MDELRMAAMEQRIALLEQRVAELESRLMWTVQIHDPVRYRNMEFARPIPPMCVDLPCDDSVHPSSTGG